MTPTMEDAAYEAGEMRFNSDFPDSWGLSQVAGAYIRELPYRYQLTAAELNDIHDNFERGWYARKTAVTYHG